MADQLTKDFIKAWGASEVPTASLVHGKLPIGEYAAFALLAWIEQRKNGLPIVGMQLTVLGAELDEVAGSVTMGLPLSPTTERHVCCFLEDLGWDGRCWPYRDHGWPEGGEDEPGLLSLLKRAKLGATLTFPPHAQGTPTVLIPVFHRTRPFSVAPFYHVPPVPTHLENLRSLAIDPIPFKSDWE